jgi:hypothetical protein
MGGVVRRQVMIYPVLAAPTFVLDASQLDSLHMVGGAGINIVPDLFYGGGEVRVDVRRCLSIEPRASRFFEVCRV